MLEDRSIKTFQTGKKKKKNETSQNCGIIEISEGEKKKKSIKNI